MATGRVPTTANSPLTAKGDLFGYSTTQARVPVGNNGETIVADSSTSTGLRYQAPYSQQPVINSAFQVWQRGTSFATAASGTNYTADRWIGYRSVAGGTVSRQLTNDTTNLPFIQYCARVQRDSGNTNTALIDLVQPFETINSIPFVGKTVTLSFYARKGADFSSASSAVTFRVLTGTSTDQNPIVGYTGGTAAATGTATLTTTWQRFTVTGTVGTTATELSVEFYFTPVGTAGAADYFEMTGVQLEVGSVATPFHTYAGTIQGELAACQRYYYRTFLGGGAALTLFGTGVSSTSVQLPVQYPVNMRTVPTAIDYGGGFRVVDGTSAVNLTSPTLSLVNTTASNTNLNANGATGLTQYRPYALSDAGAANAYYGISAEL
jgi:hypothetical protein